MRKYYVVFVVSELPIDTNFIEGKSGTLHFIKQEIETGKEIVTSDGEWKIEKATPENCNGVTSIHTGRGGTISVAITDWIKNLCSSIQYVPFYKKTNSKK